MKRYFAMICAAIAMTVFLGTNMAVAQDAKTGGCCKMACFDKMDGDKNGQVSEAEFLERCKKRFSGMDADNSGALSKDEFKPGCKGMQSGKKCPYKQGSTSN